MLLNRKAYIVHVITYNKAPAPDQAFNRGSFNVQLVILYNNDQESLAVENENAFYTLNTYPIE
jgi:hypothetical protein